MTVFVAAWGHGAGRFRTVGDCRGRQVASQVLRYPMRRLKRQDQVVRSRDPRTIIDILRILLHSSLDFSWNCRDECKVHQLRDAWLAGDQIGALRIAARFFDQSADPNLFKRGMAAHNNPDFYRLLGKKPDHLVRNALNALKGRFSLC